MRVQSPDAGKSDKVAKNRGFVFIPEPGDLVMVGFEQGNPDRPYVTGSLFYKANSEGAATDNSVKRVSVHAADIYWSLMMMKVETGALRLKTITDVCST